jgi:hypothetical protein
MSKLYNILASLLLIGALSSDSSAQELNFEVEIIAPNLATADREVLDQLQNSMREFINNTKWTNLDYQEHEKITGSIQYTIKQDQAASFSGELIIQVARPVYNSEELTPLMNHVDRNVQVAFQPDQQIQRSDLVFTDNLSSILTFYVYVILGLDGDSFEQYGGTDYFNIALNTMTVIPQGLASADRGWKAGEKYNRNSLITSILNARVKPFRQAYYEYHREGLDKMTEDRGRARAIMASAITQIGDVNQAYPYAPALEIFFYAKRGELSDIFEVAPKGQRKKVYDVATAVDPILAEALRKLNN